jgi:hypothetical protein
VVFTTGPPLVVFQQRVPVKVTYRPSMFRPDPWHECREVIDCASKASMLGSEQRLQSLQTDRERGSCKQPLQQGRYIRVAAPIRKEVPETDPDTVKVTLYGKVLYFKISTPSIRRNQGA